MTDNKNFTVTDYHLKLMQRMYVGWDDCEFGAPSIEPKRPYGNSNVIRDIIEIIGIKELKKGIFEFEFLGEKYLLKGEDKFNIELDDEQELIDALTNLHKETETSLQIALSTGKFEVGKYHAQAYSTDWKKVE